MLEFVVGPRRAVQFRTALPVDSAVQALSAHVQPSRWPQSHRRSIYGRVSEGVVYMERITPGFQNSWRPVFEGEFQQAPQGAVLVGTFGAGATVTRFTTAIVTFAILWTLAATAATLLQTKPKLPMWFPLCGLAVGAAAIAIARIAARASAEDIPWLTAKIEEGLGAHAS